MAIEVVVLVSVGVHPLSGRPRRADLDARAVELALRLTSRRSDVTLHAVHAGRADEASLGQYLGMGLDRLTVLDISADADPLPPLVAFVRPLKPAITLAGMRSEGGEGSGFLPYALAHTLGLTLAPAIVDLAQEGSLVRLTQALSGGRRRCLSAPLPVLVTIDRSAPEPRQSAYGRTRRGHIDVLNAGAIPDPWRHEWRASPARKRPRRLACPVSGSAAERLQATMDVKVGSGSVLCHPNARQAALAIWDFLLANGLAAASSGRGGSGEEDLGRTLPGFSTKYLK